jgi:hypothetical protein
MPFYPSFAEAHLRLASKNKFSGDFAALGRVTPLYDISYGFMKELSKKYNFKLRLPNNVELNTKIELDKDFFKLLHFDTVQSIDFDDSEGAEFLVDMNNELIDDSLFKKFDVIFNNGTIEHVFHVPNFLSNITKMLKDDGFILHMSPVNNWVDHGFYQISPTLYLDYYLDNNFTIKECKIFRYVFSDAYTKCDIEYINDEDYYSPLKPINDLMGKFDNGLYGCIFLAQKNKASTYNKIPTQSIYANESIKAQRKLALEKNKKLKIFPFLWNK